MTTMRTVLLSDPFVLYEGMAESLSMKEASCALYTTQAGSSSILRLPSCHTTAGQFVFVYLVDGGASGGLMQVACKTGEKIMANGTGYSTIEVSSEEYWYILLFSDGMVWHRVANGTLI